MDGTGNKKRLQAGLFCGGVRATSGAYPGRVVRQTTAGRERDGSDLAQRGAFVRENRDCRITSLYSAADFRHKKNVVKVKWQYWQAGPLTRMDGQFCLSRGDRAGRLVCIDSRIVNQG